MSKDNWNNKANNDKKDIKAIDVFHVMWIPGNKTFDKVTHFSAFDAKDKAEKYLTKMANATYHSEHRFDGELDGWTYKADESKYPELNIIQHVCLKKCIDYCESGHFFIQIVPPDVDIKSVIDNAQMFDEDEKEAGGDDWNY
jgi:hypothetical protein